MPGCRRPCLVGAHRSKIFYVKTNPSMRGVKTRLLGFTLMVLGVLDSLLTLRGGIPAYEYLLLVLAGACIFAIGAVRGARRGPEKSEG